MSTFLRVLGALTGVAWVIVFAICVSGLVRTNSMAHDYSVLAGYSGHAFDPPQWKTHWVVFNICICAFAALGCYGAMRVWKRKGIGFLILSVAAFLWCAMITLLAMLDLWRYRYEHVGIYGRLELLGIALIFLVLFFLAKKRWGVASVS
jgi:hypothetical protein